MTHTRAQSSTEAGPSRLSAHARSPAAPAFPCDAKAKAVLSSGAIGVNRHASILRCGRPVARTRSDASPRSSFSHGGPPARSPRAICAT